MTKAGTIEYDVKINTKQFQKQTGDIRRALSQLSLQSVKFNVDTSSALKELKGMTAVGASEGARAGEETGKSFGKGINKHIDNALGAIKNSIKNGFVKSFESVKSSIKGELFGGLERAVSRLDILKAAPRNFANMGFAAEDSRRAMEALKASVKGLPTPLDSATKGMTILASSMGDIQKAQKVFSGLNNAILGFGGTAEDVNNAIIQMSQAFSAGRIDGQTFLSMMNSGMGPVVTAIGAKFGYAKGQVKDALLSGKISTEQFQDALIELNEKGGAGMASLDSIAHGATSGIGTSFANAKTAIADAWAGALDAIGQDNISAIISSLGQIGVSIINSLKPAISFLKNNREAVVSVFKSVLSFMPELLAALTFLAVRFAALKIGMAVQGLIKFAQGLKSATLATSLFNTVLGANPLIRIATAIAGVIALLIWLEQRFGFVGAAVGFLMQGFSMFSSFVVGLFNQIAAFLLPIIQTVIGVISTIIQTFIVIWATMFNVIVTIVTTVFNVIVAVFMPIVDFVVGVFTTAWNGIAAVWNVVAGFFGAVWGGIVAVFSPVIKWFGDIFRGGWNGIKTVWDGVKGFFEGVWNGITSVFSNVKKWFSDTFQGAKDAITNVFKGIGNIIKAPLNVVIGLINGVIDGLNMLKVPGTNIGVNIPKIPKLARGGVVSRPTLAMIGEAGDEAVVPLKNNTQWLDGLSDRLGSGKGATVNINISGVLATDENQKRQLAEMIGDKMRQLNKMRLI